MNEKKSTLVNLNKFSFAHNAFCFLQQPATPALQLEKYYSTQKNNPRVYKKKIRHLSSSEQKNLLIIQENLLSIDGKEYRIEHNFENEKKSDRKKDRKKRYPSGVTSVVKKLIPFDENDLDILRLKCFNQISNGYIYNNDRKTAEKYLLSVNVHKNIFKRNNTAFYMRAKNGSIPKFYMIMDDLGEHDLLDDINNNLSYYQDEKKLPVRLDIGIKILEQVQLLFDHGIRWLDPKIENVIVRYNSDRTSCCVEITDFDSIIEEKKSTRERSPHITYMPKSRKSDYCKYKNQPLLYSPDKIFDRGYVVSVLSFTLSELFPDFIQQVPETLQSSVSRHNEKNFFIPSPQTINDNNKNKEQILKVIQHMYNRAKKGEFDNTVNLKKYISQLKAIKQQLHPSDINTNNQFDFSLASPYNSSTHHLSDVAHHKDDDSKNLRALNMYYRIKFMTGIGFISVISWNLLDQSYKSFTNHTIFKTSGIIAYIATAVFCLMLCAYIIHHKTTKKTLQKESWCTIFGLISATIGCIVFSFILSNQSAFLHSYSEQALGCFLAAILLLAMGRQLRYSANRNGKCCISFEALFILIQLLTVGVLLSASLVHNNASIVHWTILCALGFGILTALTMTIKDIYNGKKLGVDYLPIESDHCGLIPGFNHYPRAVLR